jgi:pilus assembly protein CpaC
MRILSGALLRPSLLLMGLALAGPAFVSAPTGVQALERLLKVSGGSVEQMRVTKGKSETIRTQTSFADLVVGDPEIADVVPLTDQSFYVLGKGVGQTNISVYDSKKQMIGIVDIEVGHDAQRLQEEISQRISGATIRASTVNGKIMLSGTAPDASSVERAMTIAKQFGPDVINSLSVGTSQQVMLEVRFVEVQRDAGRDLGINFGSHNSNITFNPAASGYEGAGKITYPTGTNTGGLFTGAAALLSGNAPYASALVQLAGNGFNIEALVRALEEKGVARRLAEPNLVALSGDTASFLAGGEIPIPIANTDGQVTISYKTFGVGLAFTPTVLDKGQINLKIIPEVSELDYSNAITLSNTSIPSLVVRRANTTVEMRDGQSLAIAGLLQTTNSTAIQQMPWIANMPVLGALFRSTSFQKHETELVVIITPHLVRPVAPGMALKTPIDEMKPGTDAQVFAMGKPETRDDLQRFIAKGGNRPLLTGHIIADPKGEKNVASR